MLLLLEVEGMLDNTIVIVTADNGMPFPRAKGQAYEVSNHLPLAIRWPKGIIQPGRTADGYVSFIDFAPTFLEIADVLPSDSGMQPITGRSLMDVLSNEHEGAVMPIRDQVLIGKERHDVGRPDDVGYPIRGIIKDNFLYIVNFETERWPAGNPETGYLNTDGSPTKSQILNMRRAGENERFWEPAFGKRPAEELYRLDLDPDCMNNLAENPEYENQRTSLREQLFEDLRAQGDPRIVADGAVFDEYPYANAADTSFYSRYMAGDSINAGWVNPSDFEAEQLE
jgi:arylsulfatase A-like enzyme